MARSGDITIKVIPIISDPELIPQGFRRELSQLLNTWGIDALTGISDDQLSDMVTMSLLMQVHRALIRARDGV